MGPIGVGGFARAMAVSLLFTMVWAAPTYGDEATDQTVILSVSGLTCSMCTLAVDKAVGDVDGVKACNVDEKAGRAEVTADKSVEPEALVKAIAAAGFESKVLEVR